MKRLIIIITIILPLVTIAQKDTAQHKWAIGVDVSSIAKMYPYDNPTAAAGYFPDRGSTTNKSFSLGIAGNYFFSSSLSVKAIVGVSTIDIENYRDTRTEYYGPTTTYPPYTINATINQSRYYIELGLQNDFYKTKKSCLFAGLIIPVTIYGRYIYNETETDFDSTLKTISDFTYLNQTIPGGVSVGVGPYIGFRYRIFKHIYISSEITDALLYQSLGGTLTGYNNIVNVSGPTYYNPFYYKFTSDGWSESGVAISLTLLYIN